MTALALLERTFATPNRPSPIGTKTSSTESAPYGIRALPVPISPTELRGFATDQSDADVLGACSDVFEWLGDTTQTSTTQDLIGEVCEIYGDYENYVQVLVSLFQDVAHAENESTRVGSPQVETPSHSVREFLIELRRLAGLTWDELSSLLNVERRSLHNWSAGKPISKKNEKKVADVLATLRYLDRGTVASNRSALFSSGEEGKTVFRLISEGRLDDANDLARKGDGRQGTLAGEVDRDWVEDYGPLRLADRLAEPFDNRRTDADKDVATKPSTRRTIPIVRK